VNARLFEGAHKPQHNTNCDAALNAGEVLETVSDICSEVHT
jgi:hypothetical protein